jgi:hypothetical protein
LPETAWARFHDRNVVVIDPSAMPGQASALNNTAAP